MSYGFATHLWIHGTPIVAVLKNWILAAAPDATDADLSAIRLGDRTLLAAVNTNDREVRWRSIGIVGSVPAHIEGFDWTLIDIHPDASSCEVTGSALEAIRWDDSSAPSAALVDATRQRIRHLVPLKLEHVHHYVDWAHELEDVDDGGPAPHMSAMVELLSLGLPPRAPGPVPPNTQLSFMRRALPFLILAFCVIATWFTVSVTERPGPQAFVSRALHVEIQASLFWLLAVFGGDVSHPIWSRTRLVLTGLAAITVSAGLWGISPT